MKKKTKWFPQKCIQVRFKKTMKLKYEHEGKHIYYNKYLSFQNFSE